MFGFANFMCYIHIGLVLVLVLEWVGFLSMGRVMLMVRPTMVYVSCRV